MNSNDITYSNDSRYFDFVWKKITKASRQYS
jgi:hypothetical protein